MTGTSNIEWTDATWNPTTGCDRVSPGCDHCYALVLAKRLQAMGQERYARDGDPRTSGPGFGLTVHAPSLLDPLSWVKDRIVFVNSMSDLFHDEVPDEFIAHVWAVMAVTPRHTYQVLTKRAARMRSLLNDEGFRRRVSELVLELIFSGRKRVDVPRSAWPLANVWVGVSAEDEKWAGIRIPQLVGTPAAVRFVSAEPLLGDLGIGRWLCSKPRGPGGHTCTETKHGLHWVIVGGESGGGARRMDPAWASDVVARCRDAGVAVFVKQVGSRLGRELGCRDPKGHDMDAWPEHLRIREMPARAEVSA